MCINKYSIFKVDNTPNSIINNKHLLNINSLAIVSTYVYLLLAHILKYTSKSYIIVNHSEILYITVLFRLVKYCCLDLLTFSMLIVLALKLPYSKFHVNSNFNTCVAMCTKTHFFKCKNYWVCGF